MDLYLNLTEETVYRDRNGNGGNIQLRLNQGDKLRVRLWLMQAVDGPTLREPIPLPSPYTLINLSGKAKDDLDAVTPLFSVGAWSAVSVVFNAGLETEYTEVHYEADLSLNTTQINEKLDPSGGTAIDEVEVYWSVELSNGAAGAAWLGWTPLPRGEGKVLRDLYPDSGSAPVDADPPYPAADQIAPISGGNFQFVLRSGVWQLEVKNTTTGAFHKVTIQGASGAEVLVIDEAS